MNKLLNEIKQGKFTFILVTKDAKVTSTERGIKPMFLAITQNVEQIEGAIIADKVIGKAAALLAILGKPKAIYTLLATYDAAAICKQYHIELYTEHLVPFIQNRDKNGPCPMESIAENTDDPELVKIRIEKFLIEKGIL